MTASWDGFTYTLDDPVFIWHINNGRTEPYPRELGLVKSYLERFPERNNTFIDVGAHIGTTALPYSRLFKHVIAYEANSNTYKFLIENIKSNSVNNVTAYNKGVHNKTSNCTVVYHGVNSGCYYIKESEKSDLSVDVVRLDDAEYTSSVDFIKIDTEGSELRVLEGGLETIKQYKPFIQVETNECSSRYFGYGKERIFEFMKSLDYSVFDDDGTNPLFYFTG